MTKVIKVETTQEFLACGGQIEYIAPKVSGLRPAPKPRKPKSKGIDAQALLDAAVGTPQEAEVIAFLKSQGIEVE